MPAATSLDLGHGLAAGLDQVSHGVYLRGGVLTFSEGVHVSDRRLHEFCFPCLFEVADPLDAETSGHERWHEGRAFGDDHVTRIETWCRWRSQDHLYHWLKLEVRRLAHG